MKSLSVSRIAKKEGLHTIRHNENKAAIIFVHGLQGDPYKTWTKKGCISLPLLFEEDKSFNRYDLFTFGYRTGFLLKRHHFKEVSNLLFTELKTRIPHEEIYFVAHSMGGVIVQSMLIEQVERDNSTFTNRIKGIVYLAVPFAGSTVASFASAAYAIVPPFIGEYIVSIQVRSLRIFSKELSNLAAKWVRYTAEQLSNIRQKNIYGQSDRTVGVISPNPPYIFDADPVEENHRSICKIDRQSTVYLLMNQFFNDFNEQDKIVRATEAKLEDYFKWLEARTEIFLVPGIDVPLSIEDAWAGLYVMEEPTDSASESLDIALVNYHEWERLSRKGTKRNAQDVTELGKRIVLFGGPGSGKSTLARRTVHRLVVRRQKTLFVRLPNVSKEMAQGKSFEDALWSAATDGFGGDKNLIRTLLEHPNALVADGLDECGPQRTSISEALHSWVLGRPETRVVVTTRPIGHSSAQYYSYHHVEILPLEENDIDRYAFKLLGILIEDQKLVSEMHNKLKRQLEANRTASIAARSPLLLNFIIQLLISGKTFGTYRAELYAKIIEEWTRKSTRGEMLELQSQTAFRAIELIGWIIQSTSANGKGKSKREVLDALSSVLEDELQVPRLKAQEISSFCIKYWVEKGLLEHLHLGYEDALTFIHLTFGEFATARYISVMPDASKKELLLKTYHMPSWRETWLLTGGLGSARLIVETLLAMGTDHDDLYNDMVFAAAVLAETTPITDLSKKVIERLVKTICSPIPLLAYEAGKALEGLADQEPQWVMLLTKELLNSEYEWTKIISTKLELTTGTSVFDVSRLLSWLSSPPQEKSSKLLKAPSARLLWNEIVVLGVGQIMKEGIFQSELEHVAEILSKSSLSVHTLIQISAMFTNANYTNLTEILNRNFNDGMRKFDFRKIDASLLLGMDALCRIVLGIFPNMEKRFKYQRVESLIEMAKLYNGLDIGNCSFREFDELVKGTNLEVVEEVLRGMIFVLKIDEEMLVEEARWALDRTNKDYLFWDLRDVPLEDLNWELPPALELNHELLVQALGHPFEAIAWSAAKLLVAGAGGELAKSSIFKILNKGNSRVYYYFSRIAPDLFEEQTKEIVLEHLEGERKLGFRYLYALLVSLPDVHNDKRIRKVLIRAIEDKYPLIVKEAAKAIVELSESFGEISLRNAINYWDQNGVICDTHGIKVLGDCCPKCRIVPPSPLSDLLVVMLKLHYLSFEEWLHFSSHERSDVRKAGLSGLSHYLSFNKKQLSRIIIDIHEETISSYLLEAVFNTNVKVLQQVSGELQSLYSSKKADIRRRLIEEVKNCNWLSREEAELLLKRALKDDESSVRSQAVVSLRSLRQ
ncbi:NACHT domain-containing protein [Paenibacillus sp. S33]